MITFKLTGIQKKYFDAALWFTDQHGCLAEGRTTLLAISFIIQAIRNPGSEIRFRDHIQTRSGESELEKSIRSIIERDSKFKNRLTINSLNSTITCKELDFIELRVEDFYFFEPISLNLKSECLKRVQVNADDLLKKF